jgi:N6-adenosine-specific RNA methylase IME4
MTDGKFTLLNVDRERAMLDSLTSLDETLRRENDYAAMAAALKELETRDMPEAAEARRRVESLHVLALKRSGEISARLPSKPGRRTDRTSSESADEVTKSDALKSADITRQRASEREAIAKVAAEAPEDFEAALQSDEPKASVTKLVTERKKAARRADRIAKIVEISAGNSDLKTAALYPVIYADPPWEYEHVKTANRGIDNHYPTMSLDAICALPVAESCTPDAILFLWATSPKLEEAFSVVRAWDFTYRTNMVWVKDKIGMGYYARQKHELLLICARGNPPTPIETARPPSVIEAPRGKHSQKPARFHELIEAMYPEFPKLELFARAPRAGWQSFGNQAKEAS